MRYQIYILSQYIYIFVIQYVHDCCVKVKKSNRVLLTSLSF